MKIWDIFRTQEQLQGLLNEYADYRGVNACVYDLGDCVLKVFGQDDAYLLFLEFIEQFRPSKHLPKVYDHVVWKGKHLILMEKLTPIQDEEISSLQSKAEEAGWFERDIQIWLGINKSLDKVLYALEDYCGEMLENLMIEWDLHSGNIMERDGVLVVTDPWV